MERRLTLISDPTDEFPHNKNNRFKVRISNGLRLEGKGWKITLLSLTLPNSDAEKLPFVSEANNGVARSCWKILHLKGPANRPLNKITVYPVTSVILDSHVANACNGVAYWNSMIQAMETQVISNTYNQRHLLIDASDPAPVVFLKESMCPSFRWEGEDLIIKRRGPDSTNGSTTANTIYSCFDIAYEVALQWGFILVKHDGNVVPEPNLHMRVFQDDITTGHPRRKLEVTVEGV